ncbi:MAG TPA: hypothetical protein VEP90_23220, partial [Methylomirabilota bacterium]|nr:hypothetical protein [Methylomirabilota bacterium]
MRLIDWIFSSGFAQRYGLSRLNTNIILASDSVIAVASLMVAVILLIIVYRFRSDILLRFLRPLKISLILLFLLRALETAISVISFHTPYYNILTIVLMLSALMMTVLIIVIIPQLYAFFWARFHGVLESIAKQEIQKITEIVYSLQDIQESLQERTKEIERIYEEV